VGGAVVAPQDVPPGPIEGGFLEMKKLFLLVAVCCVFVSVNAFAASPIRSVGFEAGYVSPDIANATSQPDNTWMAGVFMDFGLPVANLLINPFVNYWSSTTEVAPTTDVSLSDFAIGANVKFTIPTASVKFQPFLAGGISVNMMNSEVTGSSSYDESKFGFQGGAGFKVGMSQSMSAVASGWYNVVNDFNNVDVNNWSLRAGLAWSI
jgi:opacity protein-like surface antigen